MASCLSLWLLPCFALGVAGALDNSSAGFKNARTALFFTKSCCNKNSFAVLQKRVLVIDFQAGQQGQVAVPSRGAVTALQSLPVNGSQQGQGQELATQH